MIRLNKYIAESGVCSRRQADEAIGQGRVKVNGVLASLGTRIDPDKDKVILDGQLLSSSATKQYIVFHKPKGVITTRADERNRKTIYEVLSEQYRSLDPAGRLDRNSTGVLILSNDGDFIYQLTHPRFHVEKHYRVRLDRPVQKPAQIAKKLLSGVQLEPEGVLAQCVSVELLGPKELNLVLITGYNRQIRRSFEQIGYDVTGLKRTVVGPVSLGNLPPGQCRPLSHRERKVLSKLGKK